MSAPVFIANVGNRDLRLNIGAAESPRFLSFDKGDEGFAVSAFLDDDEPADDPCDEGARGISEYLSRHFDRYATRLMCPILWPCLRYAIEETGPPGRVILLGTDQDKSSGDYWKWDTEPTARVIGRLIPTVFGEIAPSQINVVPIRSGAYRFEDAYAAIDQALTGIGGRRVVFAALSGGLPSMNAALRVHAVSAFGAKARLLEATPPSDAAARRGEKSTARLSNTWMYRRDALKRTVETLVARYQYGGALDIVREELASTDAPRLVRIEALLRHARARFNLDLEGAGRALSGLANEGAFAAWIAAVQHGLLDHRRIVEISETARILLDTEDYGGFLTRVAVLAETCRRQIASALVDRELVGSTIELRLLPTALNDFLLTRKLQRTDGEGAWFITSPFLNATTEWGRLQAGRALDRATSNALRLTARLRKLEQLRNEFVHRAAGVGAEALDRAFADCKVSFPAYLDELTEVMSQLRGDVPARPTDEKVYAAINDAILAELRSAGTAGHGPSRLESPRQTGSQTDLRAQGPDSDTII